MWQILLWPSAQPVAALGYGKRAGDHARFLIDAISYYLFATYLPSSFPRHSILFRSWSIRVCSGKQCSSWASSWSFIMWNTYLHRMLHVPKTETILDFCIIISTNYLPFKPPLIFLAFFAAPTSSKFLHTCSCILTTTFSFGVHIILYSVGWRYVLIFLVSSEAACFSENATSKIAKFVPRKIAVDSSGTKVPSRSIFSPFKASQSSLVSRWPVYHTVTTSP